MAKETWGKFLLDLGLAYKWLGRRLVSNLSGCLHP